MSEEKESKLPSHARVVIVGGSIMGCGLAYHLAHEGWGNDVVLLEKAELTSGSTWHAAGQITHSTSSYGLGKCIDYNIDLYSKVLEAETGQATVVDWSSRRVRAAWEERVATWRARTDRLLRSAEVDSMHVPVPRGADRDAVLKPILEFFHLREARRARG